MRIDVSEERKTPFAGPHGERLNHIAQRFARRNPGVISLDMLQSQRDEPVKVVVRNLGARCPQRRTDPFPKRFPLERITEQARENTAQSDSCVFDLYLFGCLNATIGVSKAS